MDYKRLGDYIRPVDERNSGLEDLPLMGLSITKEFIPSVANIIGTDLSKYKVVRKNQFACSLMQVSRDGKMPIAMLEQDKVIMSPAYPVFEIKDDGALLPKYLMMWFARSEFDREAAFNAVGGVRGNLPWEDFLEMRIPVPPIEKQRAIVAEYNTIQNRIDYNKQLMQKLEETVQTIYKKWFVDGIDENNLPEGWEMKKLSEVILGNPETLSDKDEFSSILYLETRNITNNEIEDVQKLIPGIDEIPSRAKRKVKNNDIVFSTVRPALKHFGILKDPTENFVVSTGFAVLRIKIEALFPELVYLFLTDEKILEVLQAKAEMSVSTYPSITINDILNLDFILPDKNILSDTKDVFEANNELINFKSKENQKLEELKGLLLAGIARKNRW